MFWFNLATAGNSHRANIPESNWLRTEGRELTRIASIAYCWEAPPELSELSLDPSLNHSWALFR